MEDEGERENRGRGVVFHDPDDDRVSRLHLRALFDTVCGDVHRRRLARWFTRLRDRGDNSSELHRLSSPASRDVVRHVSPVELHS